MVATSMDQAWRFIRMLEVEPTAKQYLQTRYEQLGLEHPARQALQQCARFTYTWRQARAYYEAAKNADLLIRPLLLFYGCVQLLKGSLIATDPLYPHNSRMLQHGVTSRKQKKSPYRLLQDEVRPQKEGLFAHAAAVWHVSPLEEKYKGGHLFASVVDLHQLYTELVAPSFWVPVQHDPQRACLLFPHPQSMQHPGTLAYSGQTLVNYLNRHAPTPLQFSLAQLDPLSVSEKHLDSGTLVQISTGTGSLPFAERHPLFATNQQGELFFWCGEDMSHPLPSWANQYLLLYLLGMLCRYETEWWGELVLTHTLSEILLVERFLELHHAQFPALICNMLQDTTGNIMPSI